MAKGKITEFVDVSAVKQLTDLQTQLNSIVKTIETISQKKVAISSEMKNSGSLQEINAQKQQQLALDKELDKAHKEAISTNNKLIAAEKAHAAALVSTGKSYNDLVAKNKALAAEFKKLDPAIEGNKKKMEALTAEYKKNNSELKKMDADMGNHQRNVGNYASANDGLMGKLKGLGAVVGIVGVAVAAGAIAWKGYQKVVATSEAMADEFKATMTALDFASIAFFKTIREGDWSNLLDNMAEAAKRGHDYAAAMDIIEKQTRAVNVAHSIESKKLSELEEKMKNKSLSDNERLEAGKELAALTKQTYDRQIELANKTFEAESKAIGISKEKLMQYVEEDAANLALRPEAEKYNKILEEKNNLEIAYKKYKEGSNIVTAKGAVIARENPYESLKKAREELTKFTPEVKAYGNLISEVEGNNKERIDLAVQAIKKQGDAQSAFFNENKRVITQMHTLEKEIADANAKVNEKALAYYKNLQEEVQKLTEKRNNQIASGNEEWKNTNDLLIQKSKLLKNYEELIKLVNEYNSAQNEYNYITPLQAENTDQFNESLGGTINQIAKLQDAINKGTPTENDNFIVNKLGDLVKELPPQIQNMVKAVIEGKDKILSLRETVALEIEDLFSLNAGEGERILSTYTNLGEQILATLFENKKDAIDAQLDMELAAAEESNRIEKDRLDTWKEQNLITEAEYARQSKLIDDKLKREKNEADKKAFENLKKQRLSEAYINAAAAAISIAASGGSLVSIILQELALAALTAIQIDQISSQSWTPKYAKGVKDAPGGMAIVSEEGPELMRLKNGQMFLTPEKESKIYVPKGAEIIPHDELVKMMSYKQIISGNQSNNSIDFSELKAEFRQLNTTIKSKQEFNPNLMSAGKFLLMTENHAKYVERRRK